MRRYRAKLKASQLATGGNEGAPEIPDDPATAIAEWSASTLRVPTGPLRGQPFVLADWQVSWLRGALSPGVREAGLSIARKNGKSGLCALVLLAHLAGPLVRPQWRGIVASLTGQLAKELRDQCQLTAATAAPSGLPVNVLKTPTPGRIEGLQGTRCDFLASDKATGHALGADLALIDEAGLIPEAGRDLWGALFSSVSGRNGRLWAISIRGSGPMFSELAERADDPAVHWTEHAAPASCALDDEAGWLAANPGLAGGIKSREYMADAARRALRSPPDQSTFRALDLNQPAEPGREMIVGVSEWQACTVETLPERSGPVAIGFDLGAAVSMTAAVAYWPETGRLEAWGAYPSHPSLRARGAADGVGKRYEHMQERGELWTFPSTLTTPVGPFLARVAAEVEGCELAGVAADRYRQSEALQAMHDAGVSWPVDWRAQGSGKDGSADVRHFQRAVIAGNIRAHRSLMLESAISESIIAYDSNGNPSLQKGRQKGRIDALQAAVLAVGLGSRRLEAERSAPMFEFDYIPLEAL